MPTQQEVFDQVATIIRDTFVAPDAAITRATVADDIPGWDSTSHVVLILTLEDHFHVSLDPEMELSDVGALVDEICQRLSPGQ